MYNLSSKYRKAVKEIINKNFTFSDLSKRFINVDSSTGNIYCPFHENHSTPAAKMYWDEERDIWIIHCFGECHRNFTAYDYVNLILCEKYQNYSSPLEFLYQNMSKEQISSEMNYVLKAQMVESQTSLDAKIKYIDSVYQKYENATDYIEELYAG